MAVPEVDRETVTSSSLTLDSVAVKVKDEPAFSAIDDALTAKVTDPALSLSVIVIVTVCVPLSVALPPETLLMAIVAASSSS